MEPIESKRTIQSIFLDMQSIDVELTDCLAKSLNDTNVRERDYQKETEFLLDLANLNKAVQPGLVQRAAVRFPNGNVTLFPSDIYFIFETNSMDHASPTFVSQVGIIHAQDNDVTQETLFYRQLKLLESKQMKNLTRNKIKFDIIKDCCKDFVIPFVAKLDE